MSSRFKAVAKIDKHSMQRYECRSARIKRRCDLVPGDERDALRILSFAFTCLF
jgi:hypothetical protein